MFAQEEGSGRGIWAQRCRRTAPKWNRKCTFQVRSQFHRVLGTSWMSSMTDRCSELVSLGGGGPYNFIWYLVFFSVLIWIYLIFPWLLSLEILGWIFHQIPKTCLGLWDLNKDFKAYVTEIHLGDSWEQFNWEVSNPPERLKLKLKSHSHGETHHILWKAVDRNNKGEARMWS